jgi:hypothetical protein
LSLSTPTSEEHGVDYARDWNIFLHGGPAIPLEHWKPHHWSLCYSDEEPSKLTKINYTALLNQLATKKLHIGKGGREEILKCALIGKVSSKE